MRSLARERAAALILLALAAGAARAQDESRAEPNGHRGRIAIRVLRAGEELPVAGAEVHVMDSADRWVDGLADFLGASDFVERCLPSTRTDAQGVAWVPEPNGAFAVAASAPGEFGVGGGLFPLANDPIEVRLAPDPTLRVRVLDHERRAAAGVIVVLLAERDPALVSPVSVVSTAADGIAELRPARASVSPDVHAFVLASPWDPDVELRELDLESALPDPLEFVLGPTGALEVALLLEDGTPIDAGGIATLEPVARTDDRARQALRAHVSAPLVRGRARFDHVPVGVELVARLHPQGAVMERIGKIVRLATAGETRTLSFSAATVLPGVRARLVDPAGEPLASTPVVLHWSPSTLGDKREVTDAQGIVTSWSFVDEGAEEIALEVATRDPYRAPLGGSARFRVSTPAVADLGDVTLAPRPLLASGVVVDASGTPVARAAVRAYHVGAGGRRNGLGRDELACATDVDGRFALYGAVGGAFEVEARHERALGPTSVQVESAANDLRLVLERSGALEAKVLLDPGVPPVVQITAVGADGDRGNLGSRRPATEGLRWLLADFRPGAVTVSCHWRGLTLAEVPGVLVRAGEVTRDPRCNPIDLRGRFHAIELDVGPSVEGRRMCVVGAREHGGTGANASAGSLFLGERTTLYVPWSTVDLEFRADGFRTARIENVTGSASATLELAPPGPLVRFVLDEASRAWLGDRELTLQVVRDGVPGQPIPVPILGGRGELRIDAAGRFAIHAELRETRPGETARVSYGQLETIELGGSDPQEITLHPERARFTGSG